MSKKRRSSSPSAHLARSPGTSLRAEVEAIEQLIQRKRWKEAREKLVDLNGRYPNHPAILGNLFNVSAQLQDTKEYLHYALRLSRLEPRDPDVQFGLANALVLNMCPALAVRTYHRYLEQSPDHEYADEARRKLAFVEPVVDEMIAAQTASLGGDRFEAAVQLDEMRAWMEVGQISEARQVGQSLLRRHPDFVPALNNLSQIDFMEGRTQRAIIGARRVLELDAHNIQALSNLARYLLLSGRKGEALALGQEIKAAPASRFEDGLKQAEALSYLGDDEGVRQVYREGEPLVENIEGTQPAFFYHLAAVAALRLGDEREARRLWKQALDADHHMSLARANLDDMRNPANERHAPWPFDMNYWIDQKTSIDLARMALPIMQGQSDEEVRRATRRFLRQHPQMAALAPVLLDRGDALSRELVLNLASWSQDPEVLLAVRDFSLGQRGPDSARQRAAQIALEGGVMPSGPVRYWLDGEWREVLMMGIEIYSEPKPSPYSSQVDEWMVEATLALRERRGKDAETTLKRIGEVVPNDPSTLNNLAMAYEMQGRTQEAYDLCRQVHETYPDYFFGIAAVAIQYAREGKTDEAAALLTPLRARRRLHVTEFSALCNAEIEVAMARDLPESAQSWLDVWQKVSPDHPNLAAWRRRIQAQNKGVRRWRANPFHR